MRTFTLRTRPDFDITWRCANSCGGSEPMHRDHALSGDVAPIEMELAVRGTQLWIAMEAAQYGRVIHADDTTRAAAQEPIDAFIAEFAGRVETWARLNASYRMAALRQMDGVIDALNHDGTYVYSTSVERLLAMPGCSALQMPIAVLYFDLTRQPTARVSLPRLAAVDLPDIV